MLTVVYDKSAKNIVGATVGTYLFEWSRITVHEPGERNFHIFYELL
jgi:myosin heavy subunit